VLGEMTSVEAEVVDIHRNMKALRETVISMAMKALIDSGNEG